MGVAGQCAKGTGALFPGLEYQANLLRLWA